MADTSNYCQAETVCGDILGYSSFWMELIYMNYLCLKATLWCILVDISPSERKKRRSNDLMWFQYSSSKMLCQPYVNIQCKFVLHFKCWDVTCP